MAAPELIIRIVFVSGRVVEERGGEECVWALFADDHNNLIDHIQTIDLESMAVDAYDRDNRFDGEEVIYISDLIPGWMH